MEGVGDHQKTTKLSTMCKNIVKTEGITVKIRFFQ